MDKGIAFPTCLSIDQCASPLVLHSCKRLASMVPSFPRTNHESAHMYAPTGLNLLVLDVMHYPATHGREPLIRGFRDACRDCGRN
jgi:hypothetical protein